MRLVELEDTIGNKVTVNADNIQFMQESNVRPEETYVFFLSDKLTVKGGIDEVRRKIVNTRPV